MNLTKGELEILLNILADAGTDMAYNARGQEPDFSIEETEANLKMFQEYTEADGYTQETAKDCPWWVNNKQITSYDWWVCAHIRRKIQDYLTQTGGV